MDINKLIFSIVEENLSEVIKHRRHFHKNPELSLKEYKTQEYIIEFLEKNNIEYRKVADTGIHAYIKNGEGKKMAFRADMDALPIQEENDFEYKSINDNVMHACGHDVHMAVQMGLAKALVSNKNLWKGQAHFYFQPAEETVGGAKRMLEEGVDENIDRIYAFHSAPELVAGQIGIKYDKLHATSAVFEMEIIGKSTHAALPHTGVDSILVASKLVEYIQSIISRRIDPRKCAVITIGTFNAGTAENIVADKAVLTGTIRTLTQETKRYIVELLNVELKAFVNSLNAEFNLKVRDSYAPVINDYESTKFLEENIKDILPESLVNIEETRMDVEDMGFFLENIKGSFFRLGVSYENNKTELHTKNFTVDEKALKIGLIIQLKNALEFLC